MKFGSQTIPTRLFDLARERLLGNATSTPDQVRSHILQNGKSELQQTNEIEHNQRIIANRVFQAVRLELLASGDIAQLKRGVWATTKFLAAANAPAQP
jgi:hypothetical protein